jgi:hypothetical protein
VVIRSKTWKVESQIQSYQLVFQPCKNLQRNKCVFKNIYFFVLLCERALAYYWQRKCWTTYLGM